MSIFIHHGQSSLEIRNNPQNDISANRLSELLTQLKASESAGLIQVETQSPETVLDQIGLLFIQLDAAGGIIENRGGEMLLIYRRGFWDLPKGKIDAGESPLHAAEREIQEETGLRGLTCLSALSPSYHIYPWQNDWVLKKTHWFHFRLNTTQDLILQKEEDIEDARWIMPENLNGYWDQIYPSLHALIRSVIR